MKKCIALLTLLIAVSLPAQAAALTLTDYGVDANCGSMGSFGLAYPSLRLKGGKESKVIEKHVTGKATTLKYEGGASMDLSLSGDTVTFTYNNLPHDVEAMRMELLIDFGFSQGGKWKISDQEKEFPKDKPEKPFLYQGTAHSFSITNFEGKSLSYSIPEYSFQQLQDNREWNWKTFCWWFAAPVKPDQKTATITISSAAPKDGKKVVLVDEFGQDAKGDWPEKVKSLDELKADVEKEKAWYASLTPPAGDTYGGLPGSGAKMGLQKTGFFHVEKKGERWVLVDPDGNAFFHLGVCSFHNMEDYTYVKGRENIYAWIPPYESEFKAAFHPDSYWSRDTISFYLANFIRKYGKFDRAEFAALMIDRVRKFGFNSGGAFSNIPSEKRDAAKFPHVESLPVWGLIDVPGVRGTLDPFEPGNATKIDQNFTGLAASANDALLIGFFLSNEPNHEDLPRVIPTLPGNHACKQRLIAMLKEKYKTVDAFNTAWSLKLASFDAAADTGLAVNTKEAAEDVTAFSGIFFEAYYKLIADTFHKYDTHHLLIGNRWQPQTANSAQLVGIAGKYMDVISVNYYTYGLDKDYMKRIYTASGGKPMFLSEFYWASPKESGLPGGSELATQQERGLAYRNYVEQAAALGYVVGIEWFTLLDQARTGRFFDRYNGENGNTGLFGVADRPYKSMVNEMMKTNYDIYKVEFGEKPPFIWDNPRFNAAGGHKSVVVPKAPGAIKIDGRFDGWPGVPPQLIPKQRVVQGIAGDTEAAFRLCWDAKFLYVMVNVTDSTPQKNSQTGGNLWQGDGVELFVGSEKLDTPGALLFTDRQVLLGAGEKKQFYFVKVTEQPECELIVVPAVDGKGYTLDAAIPWDALKIKPEEGREFLFDLGVDDSADGSGRSRQIMWNGSEKNSGDRSYWGHAKLGQ